MKAEHHSCFILLGYTLTFPSITFKETVNCYPNMMPLTHIVYTNYYTMSTIIILWMVIT